MSAEGSTGARITVRIQPRASRNEVVVDSGGRIRVAITAPPVEDAANEALCRFMAKKLGLRPAAVALVKGARARDKVLEVHGMTPAEVQERLGGH